MSEYVVPTAKFTTRCSECGEYIVASRDDIRYWLGTNHWIHTECYEKALQALEKKTNP